jgi:hypothetical protein
MKKESAFQRKGHMSHVLTALSDVIQPNSFHPCSLLSQFQDEYRKHDRNSNPMIYLRASETMCAVNCIIGFICKS